MKSNLNTAKAAKTAKATKTDLTDYPCNPVNRAFAQVILSGQKWLGLNYEGEMINI